MKLQCIKHLVSTVRCWHVARTYNSLQRTRVGLFIFACVVLSGCVTESYRAGIRQNETETQVNTHQAASVRVSLGLRYLQKGDYSQAKFNLSKALELSPNSSEANYAFAYYLQKTGETALADRYYQTALSIAPNNGDTRNNYGVFLCEQQRYEEAQEQFLFATRLKDYIRSASTYENLAICAQAQQKIIAALNYLELAEQHQAKPSRILSFKAELYYQSGQYKAALEALERWFNVEQATADMLLLKHLSALAMDNLPLAYQVAQTLVTAFPHSPEATWYKNDELYRCRFEQMRSEYQRSKGKH